MSANYPVISSTTRGKAEGGHELEIEHEQRPIKNDVIGLCSSANQFDKLATFYAIIIQKNRHRSE